MIRRFTLAIYNVTTTVLNLTLTNNTLQIPENPVASGRVIVLKCIPGVITQISAPLTLFLS